MSIRIEELTRYIEKIARKIIKDDSSKSVGDGVIQEVLPGEYEVQLIEGNETSLVRAVALNKDDKFKTQDRVYLIKAETNRGDSYDTKYFIVGSTERVEQNFAELSEFERFLGDNVIVPVSINTGDCFAGNTDILNPIRANGVICFSTLVSANTSNTEKRDFGFKFTFTFEDGSIKEEVFSNDSFIGQPWKMENLRQRKIIDLGKDNKVRNIKIESFNNFTESDESFSFIDPTIESGTLLNVPNDFSVTIEVCSKKNYFNKNAQQEIVEIKANPKYKGEILDTKLIKYYWFVENENITRETEGYNSLGGEGWYCVNSSRQMKIVQDGQIIDSNVIIYNTDDNILTITGENAESWLPQYENKIKCVIGYQLANATSEPIVIYNFSHESYDISINIVQGNNPLIQKTDFIELQAKVSKRLVGTDRKEEFVWYSSSNPNEPIIRTEEQKISVFGETGEEDTERSYHLKKAEEEIYCKLIVDNTEFAESNKIKIISKTVEIEQIKDISTYTYWIKDTNSVRFIAKQKEFEYEDGGESYSYTYYVTNEMSSDAGETTESLNSITFTENGKYYVYYSEQVQTKQGGDTFKVSNYSKPKILRYVLVEDGEVLDLYSEATIEKLNTFNELTDSGLSQGIKYKDPNYFLTIDKTPDPNKLATGTGYYKKIEYKDENGDITNIVYILREQSDDNYPKTTDGSLSFKSEEEYYEQDGGDLYINATYIKTGILRVGNEEEDLLYVDVNNTTDIEKRIKIGGFCIRGNRFVDESENENVLVSPGYNGFAFWAGEKDPEDPEYSKGDVSRPFWVKTDGSFKATKGTIGGWTIDGNMLGYKQNETDTSYYSWIAPQGYKGSGDTEYAIKMGNYFTLTPHGVITASSGTIGNWEIFSDKLVNQSESSLYRVGMYGGGFNSDKKEFISFWAGGEYTSLTSSLLPPFFVTNKGRLKATQAEIDGVINATGGKLGNVSISNDSIHYKNIHFGRKIDNGNGCLYFSKYDSFSDPGLEISHSIIKIPGGPGLNFIQERKAQLYIEVKVQREGDKFIISHAADLPEGVSVNVYYKWLKWSSATSQSVELTTGSNSTTVAIQYTPGWFSDYTNNYGFTTSYDKTYTITVRNPSSTDRKIIKCFADFVPTDNNKYYFGDSLSRWAAGYFNLLYSSSGKVDGSDRNKKNSIQPIGEKYSLLFDKLNPVTFKFNDGTSNRTHIGLIAQAVKEAAEAVGLTTQEVAAYCEWEEGDTTTCGLRYEEFISLCVHEIQKLKAQVKELENKIGEK